MSGKGTFHVTNGIICKRKVHSCSPKPLINQQTLSKDNSFQTAPIQEFTGGPKAGAVKTIAYNKEDFQVKDATTVANKKDHLWLIGRMPTSHSLKDEFGREDQSPIHAWTAFNIATRSNEQIPALTNVGYCQVIDAPPTELQTVYTLLKNSIRIADLAIYAKALEVMWRSHDDFSRVVVRLGEFHTACMFMAVIGKRFGDAGLNDILIEASLVGSGSVNGVINGKHYNRALRCHKVVLEALERISELGNGQGPF